jgi:hypothetical protein
VSSWDAFLREFAAGVDSPFTADSDIAYAVYGFFQNGGRRLYITRAASPTAKKAELKEVSLKNLSKIPSPRMTYAGLL